MSGEVNKEIGGVEIHSASETLKRLNRILDSISVLHLNFEIRREIKQTTKIELIRQFFINSVPLLKNEDIEKYEKEILNLSPISKMGIKSGAHQRSQIFDYDLELKLDSILIKLQVLIKEHLMPTIKKEGTNKSY